jgi:hypothetical protein
LNESAASIVAPEAEFPRRQPGDDIMVAVAIDIRQHGRPGSVEARKNGCLGP